MPATKAEATGFVLIGFAMAVLSLRGGSASVAQQSKDELPVVKITTPVNNSTFIWNSLVNYSIVVTDHGKSTKYQEIPSKEVLLKTTFVPDLSKTMARSDEMVEPSGLMDLVNSNCMGCHAFKARSTGPSFSAIANRYPHTQAKIDALSQSIRNGTVGIWGQAAMPPHPDLAKTELHDIARWILNDASNPNVNYYVGTEGSFRMESPGKPDPNSGMALTASYVDRGTKDHPQQPLPGEDTIVVHGK